MKSTPTTQHLAAAVMAAALLSACGGKEGAPPSPSPAASAAPAAQTPAVVPVEIKRSLPPLPAPGESGLQARHGGLVETAGAHGIELLADLKSARVYLYDAKGEPAAVSDASGTLHATAGGATKSIPLTLASEAGESLLRGEGELPASFEARLELKIAGAAAEVKLLWASAGVPGSSHVAETPVPK